MPSEPLTPHDNAWPIIRPRSTDAEARACADIMSSSDPWRSLGRSFDESYGIVCDPARETYVARESGTDGEPRIVGFIVLVMQGAFVGYIQSVGVRDDWRGRGLGSELIAFAERRIFRDTPNVFICASSFNPDAQRLYERLGYTVVGELTDYIVRGHSEILFRKTRGPLNEHDGVSF